MQSAGSISTIAPKFNESEIKELNNKPSISTRVSLQIFTSMRAAAKELDYHVPTVIYTLISDYAEILKPARGLLKQKETSTEKDFDLLAYNQLAEICAKSPNFKLAETLLQEMMSVGVKPSLETYNFVIEADGLETCGLNNYPYLKMMNECSIKPDINTFRHYFSGFLTLQSTAPIDAMDKTRVIIKEMFGPNPLDLASFDAETCTILINIYVNNANLEKKAECAQLAFKFFEILKDFGHAPEKTSCSNLIKLCIQNKLDDHALEIYGYLLKKGITPDDSVTSLEVDSD